MNRFVLAVAAVLAAVPARAQQWHDGSLKGESSAICEKKTVVVKSVKDWEDLWKQHSPAHAQAPRVDFTREMVVAVFLGEKNTAGYSIQLVTMADPLDKNRLVVFYKEVPPQSFAAQVVSHPYAMLKIRIHAAVTFEDNQKGGIPPGEMPKAPARRITPGQTFHMYETVDGLKEFSGSFDGFYRP